MVWILLPTHRFAGSCHAGRLRVIARRRLPIFALAVLLLTTGCAASAALRRGIEAERRQDYDLAVVQYNKAVQVRPNDADARLGLERAKLRAAAEHFQRGRRAAAIGKYDQALVEYELAFELNPTSGETEEQLRDTRNKLRTKVAIARTYRATKTKSKTASAYHHVGPVTPLVIGGGCIVFRSNGNLQILCQGARVSVYWRWGLSSVDRIERASFVLDTVEGCPRSIRRTGHTKHGSSFTMNEDLAGASGDCRLVTARITYSYPKAS